MIYNVYNRGKTKKWAVAETHQTNANVGHHPDSNCTVIHEKLTVLLSTSRRHVVVGGISQPYPFSGSELCQ
jgi:hypothetical protein